MIGLSAYTFRFTYFSKLRKEIKLCNPLSIPKRLDSGLLTIIEIVILFGFIGLIYYLDANTIIEKIPDFTF